MTDSYKKFYDIVLANLGYTEEHRKMDVDPISFANQRLYELQNHIGSSLLIPVVRELLSDYDLYGPNPRLDVIAHLRKALNAVVEQGVMEWKKGFPPVPGWYELKQTWFAEIELVYVFKTDSGQSYQHSSFHDITGMIYAARNDFDPSKPIFWREPFHKTIMEQYFRHPHLDPACKMEHQHDRMKLIQDYCQFCGGKL